MSVQRTIPTMLLILVIAASVLVTVAGMAAGRTGGPVARRWSKWLRWAALGAAVLVAARVVPAAASDSGWFAAVLLGIPVVLAGLPLGWHLVTGRPQAAIDWS